MPAKNDLNNTRFLLDTLMQNNTDHIYFKDLESRFVMVNEAYCNRMQIKLDEIKGKSDFDFFSEEHAQKAYDDEQRIVATGEPLINKEEKETWPDGSVTWVSTSKMPIRTSEGKIIGTFGVSRDISDRKMLEEELHEARKSAEKAAKVKGVFLANMSHEIRTPLNAVVGIGDLLAGTQLNDEQREYVETINTSSESLLDIVNDILDLSKVESDKLDLEAVPFNLINAVEDSVSLMAPKAAKKGLELMQHFSGSVPEVVIGDAARLRQILLNVLSNAVKFTPRGDILVEVEGLPVEGQDYRINFLVSDTGIGMSTEETSRIFNPFEQADSSITRKYGGTGLGLAICNKLVELMGGEMTVQSEAGVGSRFKFYIVVSRSSDDVQPRMPANAAVLVNRRILLVDDNETNLRILKSEVEQVGMQALAFSSGPDALAALPSLGGIDMAVVDYAMPEMDGYTLSEKLRSSPDFGGRPILILSSSGRPRTEAALVVNRWISKPVKKKRLHEALADLLGGSPIDLPPPQKEIPLSQMATTSPHRILLVEDNRVNQKVTLKMLSKMGYDADLAEDGQQAVDAALANDYDIILMDIQMPVFDGLEATRIIRETLGSSDRPVIIGLSAHALKESRDDAFAIGMNEYLSKPVKLVDLVQAIKDVK